MNHELKVLVKQIGMRVSIKILLDGAPFEENHHFVDTAHAEGLIADIFNELTGNRHSEPTPLRISKENGLCKK
jgi:hypothetical protein